MVKEDTPILWCTDTYNVTSKHLSNYLLKAIVRNVTKRYALQHLKLILHSDMAHLNLGNELFETLSQSNP